jgi:hypothetical protein
MSIIFPASGKTFDWVHNLKKTLTKEAQACPCEVGQVVESDPMLDAISDLSTEVSVTPVSETAEETASTPEEKAVELINSATEVLEEAKEAIAPEAVSVDVAPEESETEINKVNDDVEVKIPEGSDVDEVEIEIPEKEEADEIEIEIKEDSDKDDKDDKDEDKDDKKPAFLEKETEKDDDKSEIETRAHNFGNYIHVEALSKQNKKELNHYWKDMLGMPAEFVDAMLKDS